MPLANNLKFAREAVSLTQREAADELDVHHSLISHYEAGKAPSVERLHQLAALYNVTMDWLKNG